MAIAAKKEETRYAPATRVYTHTRSSVAQPEPIRPRPQPRVRPQERPVESPRPHERRKPDPKRGLKTLVLSSVAFLTVLVLAVMVGNAMVSERYVMLEDMQAELASIKKNNESLKAQLEGSIDPSLARQAAEDEGMSYPSSGQIVDTD